ncbi:MAG TPA: PepSY domain-containing protein [Planctomycetota bacterium]|nr:PepSY domain-containing protein [Planctomycetota bacterium]
MKRSAIAVFLLAGLAGCIRSHTVHPMASQAPEKQENVEVKVIHKRQDSSLATVAPALKVSLSKAIETALAKVDGQALNAEVELENGKAMIEVKILSNGKIWEVEIDGTTGAITEVEQEDDDDDDDDEDDGDDD